METLTFTDGTVIENSHVLLDGNNLFFYIQTEMSLAEAFNIVVDPEKTASITALRFGEETVYEGYTDLCSISKDFGQISGRLRRA